MEPKQYNWSSVGFGKTDQLRDDTSAGSSRSSSKCGSKTKLDLGKFVDNIFKEDICKMSEGSLIGTSFAFSLLNYMSLFRIVMQIKAVCVSLLLLFHIKIKRCSCV
jgi:hypothetical protein